MNIGSCWHCGEETEAALCGLCYLQLRKTLAIIPLYLAEIDTEVAKQTAKTPTGGGTSEAPTPVNLSAVEAKNKLHTALTHIKRRTNLSAKASIKDLLNNLHQIQEHTPETPDPLGHLINDLEAAKRKCHQIIEHRAEATTVGACVNCGATIKTVSSERVRCGKCGTSMHRVDASKKLGERILKAAPGCYLNERDMCALAAANGVDLKGATLRKWVSRGHIKRYFGGKLSVDEVAARLDN